MFSRFFIERPIFASVISVVIVLVGSIVIPLLPVEQTPDITPPTVAVTTKYPGASAAVVEETIASVIEEEVNGVEDMIYMSSKSSNDGSYELTVTFEIGTDVDMATVLVQNRVARAEPRLPEEVKREGVKTAKKSTNIVLFATLLSEKDESGQYRYDEIYLSNYVSIHIKDELARVAGVSDVQVMGAKDYGMRLWLDPDRLKARSLTTNEVVAAIREQNVQVAAGQIGAPPYGKGQPPNFQYTVSTLGRLSDVEQFENMILKVGDDGRVLRVRDVARVELGAQAYNWSVELNGAPAIAVGVYQLPGANAVQVADGVRAAMDRLAERFPAGLQYSVPYDTTMFVKASVAEVVETLIIAVILVILTVYVFLQDFRATLIPAATIPVSLIGTFAVMMLFGFSINTLSLFGIVLAIGIVVDDAIVVVENVIRLMDEEKLSSKQATVKAMEQVTGPVIATTLVLLAVFIPTAVMPGITGRLYNQFAVTIATATVFSSINALTLSPALCGVLLRPTPATRGWFFRGFNRGFEVTTSRYLGVVGRMVRMLAVAVLLYGLLGAATWFSFASVPGGFLPDEDQGYFLVNVQLPDAATLDRTQAVCGRIAQVIDDLPGVQDSLAVIGYSALDTVVSTNNGAFFVTLKPWEQRSAPELHASSLVQRVQTELNQIDEAIAFAFLPPPITGLGTAGGFEYQLQDHGGAGSIQLQTIADDLVYAANQDPVLTRVNSNFRASVPQLYLNVDRTKVKKLGIQLETVFAALQSYLGSAYVNDFNKFGRVYRVMIQADTPYRSRAEDIDKIYVRDVQGNMIPLSTLLTVSDTAGPQTIFRFNLFPSATITGAPRAGYSSGQAIAAMERLSHEKLPGSVDYEWSGVTFQQIQAGNLAPIIFSLAIVFVYLFLAAQYESWSLPLAVMFSVPLAILGAMAATWARGLDNNTYTQIGLVLLIGLASKTAILIVEFAKERRSQGRSPVEAAVEAAGLRFRAILMTAFSFILGVVPLVVATGAGAGSRKALGTAVFGGMIAATILGVLFVPALYVLVATLFDRRRPQPAPNPPSAEKSPPPATGESPGSRGS